jgi:Flp pilus assembly protein TadD
MTGSEMSRESLVMQVGRRVRDGDIDGAEALLRDGIARAPDWPEARQELAKLLMARGRTDAALAVMRQATRDQPLNVAGWCALAIICLHAGDMNAAKRVLVRAMLLAPATAFTYETLCAPALAEDGPLGWRQNLPRRLTVLLPGHADARLLFAKYWIQSRLKLPLVARQTLRALILTPSSGEAAFLHGMTQVEQLAYREAIRFLGWARAAAPDNAGVHFTLASAAFLLGKFDVADASARAALSYGHDEARTRFLLGRVHRACGRLSDAEAELQRAVELTPDLSEPRRMVEWTVTMAHFHA